MTETLALELDRPPAPKEISDLRAAVGWPRNESDYPAAVVGYREVVAARDPEARQVGFAALVGDGVRHGSLIDGVVLPELRRRGVGRALVARAVARARESGVAIVHVDFTPEIEAFYRECGFRIGLAGTLETDAP